MGRRARHDAARPSAILASVVTELGHGDRRHGPFDDDRGGPGRDGAGHVVVAVGVLPAPGHEEVARRSPVASRSGRAPTRGIGLGAVRGQRVGGQQATSMEQRAEGREAVVSHWSGPAATGVIRVQAATSPGDAHPGPPAALVERAHRWR